MNLKLLLFGHLSKNVTNPASPARLRAITPVSQLFFALILTFSILIAFIAGLFSWGCLVMWKKRTRNRRLLSDNMELFTRILEDQRPAPAETALFIMQWTLINSTQIQVFNPVRTSLQSPAQV